MKLPRTLQDAIVYFSDVQRAFDYAVKLRWPDRKAICPRCDSDSNYFIKTRRLWLCRGCDKQFTVKVGTIFEDSPLGMDKWMTAFWMIVNARNGVSSCEIGRSLGITQKSAWFMLHRIRRAMQGGTFVKMGGPGSEIEVDETFIGGKARNMHKSKKAGKGYRHRGIINKTVVMGMLERGGKVSACVIPERTDEVLQGRVRASVDKGSLVYTDEWRSYMGLGDEYIHQVINHAEKYVDGRVHTNGLENFWSLLKRGLGGTYVSVEPFHLYRYLDEQMFRYNHRKEGDRKVSDSERFALAMSQVAGKRLTYSQLTGKDQSPRYETTRAGETQDPF
jgi:transposase-like protein